MKTRTQFHKTLLQVVKHIENSKISWAFKTVIRLLVLKRQINFRRHKIVLKEMLFNHNNIRFQDHRRSFLTDISNRIKNVLALIQKFRSNKRGHYRIYQAWSITPDRFYNLQNFNSQIWNQMAIALSRTHFTNYSIFLHLFPHLH